MQTSLLTPEQEMERRRKHLDALIESGKVDCACCGKRTNPYLFNLCMDCDYLLEKRDFVSLGKAQEIAVEKGKIQYHAANPAENDFPERARAYWAEQDQLRKARSK